MPDVDLGYDPDTASFMLDDEWTGFDVNARIFRSGHVDGRAEVTMVLGPVEVSVAPSVRSE